MRRRIFIDSSVLIEYMKGNERADKIMRKMESERASTCINAIVTSEIIYIYIRDRANRSTEELRRSPDIVKRVDLSALLQFIESVNVLPETKEVVLQAAEYIQKHGLLPNDALILATAKEFDCALATLDEILRNTAQVEGIPTITD